uniref:DUF4399 domain-containing protein n=1 Tax=Polyblepharides amylifera TaxID=1486889 RepID=A0A7R9SUY7_9CHLO|mmetsp:Transcript_1143/g.1599  ORF Transcript_1143/g.1599 Transcript_1143/m.1599 type:complete len:188 (+) Transcript_1143:92-655(+)
MKTTTQLSSVSHVSYAKINNSRQCKARPKLFVVNNSSEESQKVEFGRRSAVGLSVSLLVGCQSALSAAPAQARDKIGTYWIYPANGATVSSPFEVKMGVKTLEVSPASAGFVENSGHHHIMIDQPTNFYEKGKPIPFESGFIHYGKAQTSGTIELPPGKHKLTLQFANYRHESFGKNLASTINITVK